MVKAMSGNDRPYVTMSKCHKAIKLKLPTIEKHDVSTDDGRIECGCKPQHSPAVVFRNMPLALLLVVAQALPGCSPIQNSARWQRLDGPEPALTSTGTDGVAEFAKQQAEVATSLISLAGLTPPLQPGSPQWRDVAEAGATYVDNVCDQYIDAIFWFDRWRGSAKSGLALTGATAASALALLDAATTTVALTAAAFGLTGGLIDVGANSVLYSIEPSAVRVALKRAQAAYRDDLATKTITSQGAAIAAAQGYLSLCLPPALETLVNTAVTTADIRTGPTMPGNPVPQVLVNPSFRADQPPPAEPALPPAEQPAGARNAVERSMRIGTLRTIQDAICVPVTGAVDPATVKAIGEWRVATHRTDDGAPLSESERALLPSLGPCDRKIYRNAFERFSYPDAPSITALQRQIEVAPTGILDDATRTRIKQLHAQLGLAASDEISPAFLAQIAP